MYNLADKPAVKLAVIALATRALDNFRRDLGVKANPEDAPAVCDRYLADAYDALDALEEEENG